MCAGDDFVKGLGSLYITNFLPHESCSRRDRFQVGPSSSSLQMRITTPRYVKSLTAPKWWGMGLGPVSHT